ncbi:hypothetical protein [Pseudogracilibacillus auburnensis]|uniref:hypothetical protein n=1 Tax=Pseudogracilibacillus auburnensis TaxID=1494959 RepID=UPI001A971F5B|nr:hypothetical protein [Pseudogracilibacillus auburnensis]MBO1005758.1 hypothetical protein [Pseudogracilibacillus auburnensis]
MYIGNNFYSLDDEFDSLFIKGKLINVKDERQGSWRLRGVKHWAKYLGLDEIKKGVTQSERQGSASNTFQRKGIAYEFSKIKTEKDIHQFANKYGLLGIATPKAQIAMAQQKVIEELSDSPLFSHITSFFEIEYGKSYFEPLEVWWFYIDQIRKLLKLYKTLTNIHAGSEDKSNIEYNVLNIGQKVESNEKYFYIVEWWDGTNTECLIKSELAESGDFLRIARSVLIDSVNKQTSRGINSLAIEVVETNKPPLGFHVREGKSTEYLINTIYYDLWNLISNNEPVYICSNPNCRLPFQKVKRQKYCTNACKQEAYRIRKKD